MAVFRDGGEAVATGDVDSGNLAWDMVMPRLECDCLILGYCTKLKYANTSQLIIQHKTSSQSSVGEESIVKLTIQIAYKSLIIDFNRII